MIVRNSNTYSDNAKNSLSDARIIYWYNAYRCWFLPFSGEMNNNDVVHLLLNPEMPVVFHFMCNRLIGSRDSNRVCPLPKMDSRLDEYQQKLFISRRAAALLFSTIFITSHFLLYYYFCWWGCGRSRQQIGIIEFIVIF